MNIINAAAAFCCCIAAGGQNRPSIPATMKDEIKTYSGEATKKSPSVKNYQKARQIVDS